MSRADLTEPPADDRGWTTPRLVSLVAGSLLALVAVVSMSAGAGLLVAEHAAPADTEATASRAFLGTTGYAVTATTTGPGAGMMHGDLGSPMPDAMTGRLRITAAGRGGKDVFVGIAPTVEVDHYLGSVSRCVVPGAIGAGSCTEVVGGVLGTPPAAAGIWARQSSGPRAQSVTWPRTGGSWTMVVMNADGSPAVAADVVIATSAAPASSWSGVALVVGALLLGALATLLVVLPVRRARDVRRRSEGPATVAPAVAPAVR